MGPNSGLIRCRPIELFADTTEFTGLGYAAIATQLRHIANGVVSRGTCHCSGQLFTSAASPVVLATTPASDGRHPRNDGYVADAAQVARR
jgi:hypothetical protein